MVKSFLKITALILMIFIFCSGSLEAYPKATVAQTDSIDSFIAWYPTAKEGVFSQVTLNTGKAYVPATWSIHPPGDSTIFTLSSGVTYNWIMFESIMSAKLSEPSLAMTFDLVVSSNLVIGEIISTLSGGNVVYNNKGDTAHVAVVWTVPTDTLDQAIKLRIVPKGIGVATFKLLNIVYESVDGSSFKDGPLELAGQTVVEKFVDYPGFATPLNEEALNTYYVLRSSIGDVNGSGTVTPLDAALILRRSAQYNDFWRGSDPVEFPTPVIDQLTNN